MLKMTTPNIQLRTAKNLALSVWLAISMEQGIESLLCYTSNKIYD
jgi:hypothetical protein